MADLGDLVPLVVEIRDAAGALANAGAITLTITRPDGTTESPTPTNPSVGRYEYLYTPLTAGRYVARWLSTGLNAAAHTEVFDVRPAESAGLMSLAVAKAALNMDATSTADDEELRSLIEAVTAAVELYRGEVVVRRTITEHFTVGRTSYTSPQAALRAYPARKLVLAKPPVMSVTSIVRPFDGMTWGPLDVAVTDPPAGVVVTYGEPFWGDLVATYVAGYSVIPSNVIEAAKIILRHLWQTQQTPGLGASVFGAGADVTAGIAGLGFALPNRAMELLGGKGITIA